MSAASKPPFAGEVRRVRLGDVCDICSGGTPTRSVPEYWEGGSVPWVKIGDMVGRYVSKTEEMITAEGVEHSSAKLLSAGTLLYSIFASIGAVAILGVPAATNQAIAGLTLHSSDLDRDYLYYWLCSRGSTSKAAGRGAAQNNINLTILRNMEISIPPLNVQRRVVQELDRIFGLIDCARCQLSLLDNLVKSRFVEMFGDGDYFISRLDEVACVQGGLTKNKRRECLPLQLPYLRVANVLDGAVDLSEMKSIGLTEAEAKKCLLELGDVLFVEGNGSADQIGRAAIWESQISPCVHQNHLIRARCSSEVLPIFVLHYFMSAEGRRQIISKAVSTSGLHTLSTGKIKALELPLPPLALQREFADFAAEVAKSQVVVRRQIEKLQTLYDSLSQEYFG